ncbi:MAG: YdcF family protein [Kiritimatiellae bacterium]|nr:YdcF family protein [Kiritimatiellia bacterium]
MTFLLKTIISRLLHPTPLILWTLVAGVLFRRFGSRCWRKVGNALVLVAALLFVAFGAGAFNPLLKWLEMRCPPFDGDDAALCESMRGATITVLGMGLEDTEVPERFCDNDGFRRRLSEGAYVAHCIPESRLVVSMSGPTATERKERAIEQFVKGYGLDPDRVFFYEGARDTREEALSTIGLFGTSNMVVVTSASHMPRSLVIFRKQGADPVPAPCDYRYFGDNTRWNLRELHFGLYNFARADRVIHEAFGLLYEKVR